MKSLLKVLAVLAILGGAGAAAYRPLMNYLEARNKTEWRTQRVDIGDITQSVNSTGKVEPVKRVSVGASVSGPISELFVDFNTKVTKGQLMAKSTNGSIKHRWNAISLAFGLAKQKWPAPKPCSNKLATTNAARRN